MFKNWYKYQHHKVSDHSKIVDYFYFYFCIPYFLRGTTIFEHQFRLAFSFLKVSGYLLPKIVHVSLPFGIWYGSGSFHREPSAK